MIDASLERHLADTKELLANWKMFRDLFNSAVKKEPIAPDKEMLFLRVKSKIAMLHDSYMEALKGDAKVAQNIIQLVERSITLKHVSQLSIAETKKFEIEWHESYLQVEETVGQLDEERQRLATVTVSKHRMTQMSAAIKRTLSSALHSAVFKLACVAVVLVAVLVALVAFDLIDKLYENPSTRKIAVMVYQGLRMAQPNLPYKSVVNELAPRGLPGGKPAYMASIGLRGGEKDQAAALARWKGFNGEFSAAEDLKGAVEYIKQEVTCTARKAPFEIHYFRFETVDKPKEIMERFGDFREEQGMARESNPDNQTTFFRKANVIILVGSKQNIDGCNFIREKVFGVKFES